MLYSYCTALLNVSYNRRLMPRSHVRHWQDRTVLSWCEEIGDKWRLLSVVLAIFRHWTKQFRNFLSPTVLTYRQFWTSKSFVLFVSAEWARHYKSFHWLIGQTPPKCDAITDDSLLATKEECMVAINSVVSYRFYSRLFISIWMNENYWFPAARILVQRRTACRKRSPNGI